MSTPSQTRANRANSENSTGPRTEAGKAAASQNSFKHGLASGRLIIPGEDPAAYNALLADLTAEHDPATVTETLLVTTMAQQFWFMQRAIRLQQDAFARVDMEKQIPIVSLPLLVRYETAAHRAFHKALSTLITLRKQRKQTEIGSVSQNQEPVPAPEPAPVSLPQRNLVPSAVSLPAHLPTNPSSPSLTSAQDAQPQ